MIFKGYWYTKKLYRQYVITSFNNNTGTNYTNSNGKEGNFLIVIVIQIVLLAK